ncbi:MAG: glycoside hydrolase family 95 protein, partial [Clostridia bacterium]|nr:glycoside hydrolase family 95 protein [Clostridia bacterium]
MSKFWYNKPAKNWNVALPLGNGRLGAMIYGDVYNDRIQINEETLWSGQPGRDDFRYNRKDLDDVRSLLAQRKYVQAASLADKMIAKLQTPG